MNFKKFHDEVECIKVALEDIELLMDFIYEDKLDSLNNLCGFAVEQLQDKYNDTEGLIERYVYKSSSNQDELRSIFYKLIDRILCSSDNI
jgi:hypothetical protein